VRSTFDERVVGAPGDFAGMFSARFPGMAEPVLVATNDGVGTKTRVAARAGRHEDIGRDIVHHCVNDALVQGAEPLFFLDYFASARLDPRTFESVVAGIAAACREHRTALLAGETAEMPGTYVEGEYDVAGFLVGVVDRARAWPRGVAAGDALVGVGSDGLHTNGYSFVNRLLDGGLALDADAGGEPLAEALLRPHRSYLRPVRALRERVEVHALAHVTGGSFRKNLPRVLPAGVGGEVDLSTWSPPPVFRLLLERAGLAVEEGYDFLNMGCGRLGAGPAREADAAVRALVAAGERAWVAGRLVAGSGASLVGRPQDA
jgi:phosphoribosylformylglycinamidine cyclo-ligase